MKKIAALFIALAAVISCVIIFNSRVYAADGPVITVQPEDVEVNYPDGATFHVEVDDPENVASYQWQMSDGYNLFILDGISATTDTLIVPSVTQDDPTLFFDCLITDKNGNTVESDPAVLTILNKEEDKTVLYVGEYSVEPGESLDLADTALGSGTVTFDADGANITFQDFKMDNSIAVEDRALSPGTALFFERRNSEVPEYFFHFLGECSLLNTFFDEDYNSGGVTINAFFGTGADDNHPLIVIDGDGLLSVTGGGNFIYTDADIELRSDMKLYPYGDYFADGIKCHTLLIDDGVNLEIHANGTTIHCDGDLRLYNGSKADLYSTPSRVSVGPTVKDSVFMGGSVYAQGAEINITGYGDPDRFVPYERYLAMMCGISLNGSLSTVSLDASRLSINLYTGESDEAFSANFTGIGGPEISNSMDLTNGSSVKVQINTPIAGGATGLQLGGLITMDEGSEISLDVQGTGETFGMIAERELDVTDASIDSNVISTDGGPTYGIVCGGANIQLNDPHYKVHSVAEGGIALAADTGDVIEEEIDYVPDYTASSINLSGKARIESPKGALISLHSVPGYGSYIKAETVFASADTDGVAHEVLISAPVNIVPYIISLAAVLILIVAAILMWIRSTKKSA